MTDMVQVPRKALEWITSRDTGLSSEVLWSFLVGVVPARRDHPHDVDDLGWCIRLLRRVPEWREMMPAARALSPEWAALVNIWDDLERLYLYGDYESCYARMEQALKEARP